MKMHESEKIYCQHFNECSGCNVDLNATSPPVWNDVLQYFEDKGVSPIRLYTGSTLHWRYRAKLAIRGSSESPSIGLFKAGSHDILAIPFCQIHHPHINQAVEYVKDLIREHSLIPYNEQTNEGELRYVQLVVQRATGKVQITFVINFKNLLSQRAQQLKILFSNMEKDSANQFWHSVWINLNHKLTNTIFGPDWHLCYGEELLWEQFGGISIGYQPASFAQANLNLFEKMLFRLEKIIHPKAKIAEFYAGVGVIGLFLASKSLWVRCAELNANTEFCFSKSRERMPSDVASRVSFHTGAADKLLSILDDAEVAIVDPPRKGLDMHLLKALNHSDHLNQLIYISCGWESFKRDCEVILAAGWKLSHVEGYWFFAGSNHIETLASFRRK